MVRLEVFCLLAAYLQTISSQCIPINYPPAISAPCNPINYTPAIPPPCANPITYPSPILPQYANPITYPTCPQYYPRRPTTCFLNIAPEAIVNLYSDDLIISGPVVVTGKLPFTGTVALEGALPAIGAGAVDYACGYNVGIFEEYGNYGYY